MNSDVKLFGMRAENGRWILILIGFIINVCLGTVYSYSVFKGLVETHFSIGGLLGNLPFMFFIAFFAGIFPFSGRLLERLGPKIMGLLGGSIVGLGWILSGLLPQPIGSIWALVITYGVIAGSGVGLSYSGPIAVATRWFPDKKGLAVGLTVAGFGGSPFITTYIASKLMDPKLPASVFSTMLILGIAFLVILLLLSLTLKFPPPNWKPSGWKQSPSAIAVTADYDTSQMIKTRSFWGLFVCFVIGSLAGLMVIGFSASVAAEIIKFNDFAPDWFRGLAAGLTVVPITASVMFFALFNAGGRPLFGWLTDKITPRYAAVISFVIILIASIGMLNAVQGSSLLYIVCFACLWLCLGGWLAIAPTATTTFFGAKYSARNYGIMLIAYGIGAILGGLISGMAKDIFKPFGGYLAAFWPTSILSIFGIFLAIFLMKPPKAVK